MKTYSAEFIDQEDDRVERWVVVAREEDKTYGDIVLSLLYDTPFNEQMANDYARKLNEMEKKDAGVY